MTLLEIMLKKITHSIGELMLDRASLMNLSAKEMIILVGEMRVLGINFGDSNHGVFTKKFSVLTNIFLVNLTNI